MAKLIPAPPIPDPPPGTTTVTFTTSQTWVAPTGVTVLLSVSGRGQDGTPGTPGSGGTPTNHSLTVAEVVYNPGGGGDQVGKYYWNYIQSVPTNAAYVVNSGGSGTFTTTYVETDPSGSAADSSFSVAQSQSPFSNSVPGSASVVYNSGWQTSGVANSSGAATLNWQEYGTSTPGTPPTTGANTTGFGITWAGGAGGAATVTAYLNISVTPGASYALTVPSGGYIIITY